jgi:energy-coupling factor transporter ATP-binding protein EcfA2
MNIDEILNGGNKSLIMTDDEKKNLITENETDFYPCEGFDFISDHKGLRPGKKHLLLGTSGSGKSTLARSICFKMAEKSKVYWYSSEENFKDMQVAISRMDISNECLGNVEFRQEQDFIIKVNGCYKSFLNLMIKDFIESQCDILFFDNLTTSNFYENQSFEDQKNFFNGLCVAIDKIQKPIFIVAHTDAKTKDLQSELFSVNDIRGQKTPSNRCEYAYAFQSITWKKKPDKDSDGIDLTNLEERKDTFIRTLKARNHSVSGKVYKLNYDFSKRAYTHDKRIDFGIFKEFYDLRVKLTK